MASQGTSQSPQPYNGFNEHPHTLDFQPAQLESTSFRQPSPQDTTPSSPGAKPKRERFNEQQVEYLEAIFQKQHFPSYQLRCSIGKMFGRNARQIQIWFQNKRQKLSNEKKERQMASARSMERVEPTSASQNQNLAEDGTTTTVPESMKSVFKLKPLQDAPASPLTGHSLSNTFDGHMLDSKEGHADVTVIQCDSLAMGKWRRSSTGKGLTGYICTVHEHITWLLEDDGDTFRMTVPFDSIIDVHFKWASEVPSPQFDHLGERGSADRQTIISSDATASVKVSRPPLFFWKSKESISSGLRRWQRCGDWTHGQQGTHFLCHHIQGTGIAMLGLVNTLKGELLKVEARMHCADSMTMLATGIEPAPLSHMSPESPGSTKEGHCTSLAGALGKRQLPAPNTVQRIPDLPALYDDRALGRPSLHSLPSIVMTTPDLSQHPIAGELPTTFALPVQYPFSQQQQTSATQPHDSLTVPEIARPDNLGFSPVSALSSSFGMPYWERASGRDDTMEASLQRRYGHSHNVNFMAGTRESQPTYNDTLPRHRNTFTSCPEWLFALEARVTVTDATPGRFLDEPLSPRTYSELQQSPNSTEYSTQAQHHM